MMPNPQPPVEPRVDRSPLPVRACDAATAAPLDDWRLAGARVNGYLAALSLSDLERRGLARTIIAQAAREPGWASGKSALACAMRALQRNLAGRTDQPPAATDALIAASAIWRLRDWLTAGPRPVPESALQTDFAGHPRFASTPPIRRINMTPARIDRRPAPWRWLRKLWGASP